MRMSRIRSWLYVGRLRDTRNLQLLRANGIDAMLQLAESIEHPGIRSLYLPIDDGEPLPSETLRRGLDFIAVEQAQQRTILIACGAGISRSVTFAVAALKEIEGLSLTEAFRIVSDYHPPSMPHPKLWDSLCTYYGEQIAWQDAF